MALFVSSVAGLTLQVERVRVGFAQNLFVSFDGAAKSTKICDQAVLVALPVELATSFSDWAISLCGEEALSSDADRNINAEAQSLLVGRRPIDWQFDENAATLSVAFDDLSILAVYPYEAAKYKADVAWALRAADGLSRQAKCGSEYRLIRGDEVPG